MNQVQRAQRDSLFNKWVQSASAVTAPWDYALARNIPSFTEYINRGNATAAQLNGSNQWAIPRVGLLKKIKLQIHMVVTNVISGADFQALASNPYAQIQCMRQVTLRSRNRDLAILTPDMIIDSINRSPNSSVVSLLTDAAHGGAAINTHSSTGAVDAATHVSDFVFEIDLPFSFTERLSNALYTDFAADLELVVEWQPSATILSTSGGGGAAGMSVTTAVTPLMINNALFATVRDTAATQTSCTLTTFDCTPVYHWVIPNLEEQAKLQQSIMAAAPEGIPRVQYDVYRESNYVLAVNQPDHPFPITCPYPTARTIISVVDAGTHNLGKYLDVITEVALWVNGQEYAKWTRAELKEREQLPPYHRNSATEQLAIDWTLTGSLLDQGGFMPMRKFANKSLRFKFNAATVPASAVLRVEHLYHVIEQMAPGNGSFSLSSFD